jgi:hypothetical protein
LALLAHGSRLAHRAAQAAHELLLAVGQLVDALLDAHKPLLRPAGILVAG